MSSLDHYTLPTTADWQTPSAFATRLRFEYDDGRPELLNLYRKGKQGQWNADERIDWSQDLDPENPEGLPDEAIPIFGWDGFKQLTGRERATVRRHYQAWQVSQFLHGEQGALLCTAKIVQQVPAIDAKYYAATQVADEARHVETYARLLHHKFELAYPINPSLRLLLEQILRDGRWDMTYLGMQILVEGLALAAFQRIRDRTRHPLIAAITAYVMQDEARHVAFGRYALRDYYPRLTAAERLEREEFVVEACYLMRDRFLAGEVWERLGLPVGDCLAQADRSPWMRAFRNNLFSRIVPTIKQIGLLGPRVRQAYEAMGVLELAEVDVEALQREDERIAATLASAPGQNPARG